MRGTPSFRDASLNVKLYRIFTLASLLFGVLFVVLASGELMPRITLAFSLNILHQFLYFFISKGLWYALLALNRTSPFFKPNYWSFDIVSLLCLTMGLFSVVIMLWTAVVPLDYLFVILPMSLFTGGYTLKQKTDEYRAEPH